MRFLLSFVVLVGLTLPQPTPAEVRVPTSSTEISLSFAPIVRATSPAVVNIYARRVVAARRSQFADDPFFRNFFGDAPMARPRIQNSLGSGVIVSSDGLVVSNYHVVSDATEIRVVLSDRREIEAQVILADEESDLAILKLATDAPLAHLALRDSDTVEVGELVLAIGNPFGVGQTVSSGIISGLARSGALVGSARSYFIQTDAAINPGNSGGALVDMAGRLVGINTSILTRSGGSNGIGFAIPANLVARFIEQAEEGRASFARPWAGVSAQSVDSGLAESLGMAVPDGIIVTDLHPESPFRAAGLVRGDVILAVDSQPVTSPPEMIFRMSVEGVGRSILLDVLREGSRRTVEVPMVVPPEEPARDRITLREGNGLGGLTASNINPAVQQELGLPMTAAGVVAEGVTALSARVGVRPGDIILGINGRPVQTTRDLLEGLAIPARSYQVELLRGGPKITLRYRT